MSQQRTSSTKPSDNKKTSREPTLERTTPKSIILEPGLKNSASFASTHSFVDPMEAISISPEKSPYLPDVVHSEDSKYWANRVSRLTGYGNAYQPPYQPVVPESVQSAEPKTLSSYSSFSNSNSSIHSRIGSISMAERMASQY